MDKKITGRGAQIDIPNRFERLALQTDAVEEAETEWEGSTKIPTVYYRDQSKSILSENSSPDIPYRFSLNPYRGCAHGCSYCYARPTHEYLGFSPGIEFESQIMVKEEAPPLLTQYLSRKSWDAEPIMMSGVTDCYQPVERKLGLTRRCIQVMHDFGQPVAIITKNALVTRDIDLLTPMAHRGQARVAISITSLEQKTTRVLEPRSSSPDARLRAVRELSDQGIPVTVMVAPVIPGLNDEEVASILHAAKSHGAAYAGYILLRLPLTVEPIFLDWLYKQFPSRAAKIESLIRQTRQGKSNDTQFGLRMRGSGAMADYINNMFKMFARRLALDSIPPPLDRSKFRVPRPAGEQLELF